MTCLANEVLNIRFRQQLPDVVLHCKRLERGVQALEVLVWSANGLTVNMRQLLFVLLFLFIGNPLVENLEGMPIDAHILQGTPE